MAPRPEKPKIPELRQSAEAPARPIENSKQQLRGHALNILKGQIEKPTEVPHGTYFFKRSKYEVPDREKDVNAAGAALSNQLSKLGKDAKLTVTLRGTADKISFTLDPRSKTPRVNLNRDATWQGNFLRACVALKTQGGIPEMAGLDFAKKGLFAVHDLAKINDQQKVMNHAIAYLRAERLQKKLQTECGNDPRLTFDIKTEWTNDTTTRVATLMEVAVTDKKPPEPPGPGPTPEPKPKPEPKPTPKPGPAPSPEKPWSPINVIELIDAVNHPKYKISRKAILKVDRPILSKESEMSASAIVQNSPSGKKTTYEAFFITTKTSPINPDYYLVVNRDDPYEIGIGRMKYDLGIFTSKSDYGAIEQVINLDKTNRARANQQIKDIFNKLP